MSSGHYKILRATESAVVKSILRSDSALLDEFAVPRYLNAYKMS